MHTDGGKMRIKNIVARIGSGLKHVVWFFRSKKGIVITGVVIAIAVSGIFFTKQIKAKQTDTATVTTQEVTPIEKKDLEKMISVNGTIASSNPQTLSVEVTDVKVLKMNVAVGDVVKKGDVIATLDSSDLEAKLAAAKLTVSAANQKTNLELAGAQRNMENAEITRNVELERANKSVADLFKDYKDSLAKKDRKYQEYQKIVEKRINKEREYSTVVTKVSTTAGETEEKRKAQEVAQLAYDSLAEQFDNALKTSVADDPVQKAALEDLKNKKEAAFQVLNDAKTAYSSMTLAGTTSEADKTRLETELATLKTEESTKEAEFNATAGEITAAAGAYDKAVQGASDTKRNMDKTVADQKDSLTGVKINSATGETTEELEIKKYEEQIQACNIVAPMDGVVTSVSVKEGDLYKSGEIATIQNTDQFVVVAAVDQYDISDVAKGMKAIVKTETTGDQEMEGSISFISPVPKSSTTSTGTSTTATNSNDYEVKVSIPNASERLRIGMSAKTSIILNSIKDALVVPYFCLQQEEDGSDYIEVSDGSVEGTSQKIVVKRLLETDYYVAIEGEGLKEGMNVVTPSDDATMTTTENGTGEIMMY